ncbi:MAG: UDP-3-O-(3-hydroxymyristoyl)glucosamine N-acyltransferase [Gammaproteobacteria bacterium]
MASQSLGQIADLVSADIRGSSECLIAGVATLATAQAGQISFLHNPKYAKYLQQTRASAVILAGEYADKCPVTHLIVADPYHAYAKVAGLFETEDALVSGLHDTVVVGQNCNINDNVSIDAHCRIGDNVIIEANVVVGAGCVIANNCHIAANTRLWPNVTLYKDVKLGQRCRIHSGVVLGGDGFGLAKHEGAWLKVPQLGGVVIGDDVDIGANTTIDCGALEDTRIGNGVKLDNLVQIGHNVIIGDHTAIAGCVGISGSVTIGEHCIIGGGACIAGHLEIVDNVTITGTGSVSRSLKQPGVYSSGTSVRPNHKWRKNAARFHHLDVTVRRLRDLEKAFGQYKQEKEKLDECT